MPNTGEDREIIHIQAPTIHKVFIAYISILGGLGLNLGAPGFASLQITCQNLVGYITDIKNVCVMGIGKTNCTLTKLYTTKNIFFRMRQLYVCFFVMRQF
jgi:hypothetical protein